MFNFAEATKDMTAAEILNYYRNLYYAEPQVTERGIVANAINDYFKEYAPRSEVARKIFEEIETFIKERYSAIDTLWCECDEDDVDDAYYGAKIEVYNNVGGFLTELKKKYTERCTDCKHFVGCECFSGMTCDEFDNKDV